MPFGLGVCTTILSHLKKMQLRTLFVFVGFLLASTGLLPCLVNHILFPVFLIEKENSCVVTKNNIVFETVLVIQYMFVLIPSFYIMFQYMRYLSGRNILYRQNTLQNEINLRWWCAYSFSTILKRVSAITFKYLKHVPCLLQ